MHSGFNIDPLFDDFELGIRDKPEDKSPEDKLFDEDEFEKNVFQNPFIEDPLSHNYHFENAQFEDLDSLSKFPDEAWGDFFKIQTTADLSSSGTDNNSNNIPDNYYKSSSLSTSHDVSRSNVKDEKNRKNDTRQSIEKKHCPDVPVLTNKLIQTVTASNLPFEESVYKEEKPQNISEKKDILQLLLKTQEAVLEILDKMARKINACQNDLKSLKKNMKLSQDEVKNIPEYTPVNSTSETQGLPMTSPNLLLNSSMQPAISGTLNVLYNYGNIQHPPGYVFPLNVSPSLNLSAFPASATTPESSKKDPAAHLRDLSLFNTDKTSTLETKNKNNKRTHDDTHNSKKISRQIKNG